MTHSSFENMGSASRDQCNIFFEWRIVHHVYRMGDHTVIPQSYPNSTVAKKQMATPTTVNEASIADHIPMAADDAKKDILPDPQTILDMVLGLNKQRDAEDEALANETQPRYLIRTTRAYSNKTSRLTTTEIMRGIAAGEYCDEVLLPGDGTSFVPFYDFDRKFDGTDEDFQKARKDAYKYCMATLHSIWEEDARVIMLDSSGTKKYKNQGGETIESKAISFHAVVKGRGAWPTGKSLLDAGKVPPKDQGWDHQIYCTGQHSMRMWGGSKAGENRPFLLVTDPERWITTSPDPIIHRYLFEDTLIQNTRGELLVHPTAAPTQMAESKQEQKPISNSADRQTHIINKESMDALAELSFDVHFEQGKWKDWIFAGAWIEEAHELDLRDKMDELSRLDVERYKSSDFNSTYRQGLKYTQGSKRTFTIGTWFKMAEKNPEGLQSWRTKYRINAIDKTDDSMYRHIAKLAYSTVEDAEVANFMFESGLLDDYLWHESESMWYQWNGVNWLKQPTKQIMMNVITNKVYPPLEGMVMRHREERKRNSQDGDKEGRLPCEGKDGSRYKRLLGSNSCRDIITATIALLLHKRPSRLIKWNAAPFKLAFENGVLDLKSGIFSTVGDREDYITMNAGWPLLLKNGEHIDALLSIGSVEVKEVDDIYSQIAPDAEVRETLWQILGSCLVGAILENVFILSGEGRNGKSLTTDMLKQVLGELAYKGDTATIQHDLNSATNQAVVNMKYRRMSLFAEPKENQRVRTSVIKDLTGSSEVHARGLYQTETKVQLCHKILIECNNNIQYDTVDTAIEKRTVVIPFPSLFLTQQQIDGMPTGTRNLYLVNPAYKTQEWQQTHRAAMLVRMFHGMRNMIRDSNGGFILSHIPASMMKLKMDLMEESDEIGTWFFSKYIKGTEDDVLTAADMHHSFVMEAPYVNWSKSEKRMKGSVEKFKSKLQKHAKLRTCYHERWQPQKEGSRISHRNAIVGYRLRRPDERDDYVPASAQIAGAITRA